MQLSFPPIPFITAMACNLVLLMEMRGGVPKYPQLLTYRPFSTALLNLGCPLETPGKPIPGATVVQPFCSVGHITGKNHLESLKITEPEVLQERAWPFVFSPSSPGHPDGAQGRDHCTR